MRKAFAALYGSFIANLALTALGVLAALGLTEGLWLIVDRPVTSPLFLAAIAFSCAVSGWRWGMVATIVSAFAIDYFFVPPAFNFAGDFDEIARITVFTIEGSGLCWLIAVRQKAVAALERSEEQLRALTTRQQELREEEQKRISLEIHDELGQALTGLKMEVHLMTREMEKQNAEAASDVVPRLIGFEGQIDSTISTIRRIATQIRPSIIDDFGLVAAIEWQTKDFERRSGIACTFDSAFDSLDTSHPESEISIFRIVQEALTNISRHSKANEVAIAIASVDGNATITIQDDGIGIDVSQAARQPSLGLLGMRERARLIGATLDIVNGKGTTIILTLPRIQ